MNYKSLITFAAIALIAASCAKDGLADSEQKTLTPVQLTLSLSQTGEPLTRTAFHVIDDTNPRQLRATWQAGDKFTLVIWQDGADWKADPKLIERGISLPSSAGGQTSVDLSSQVGTLNLSAFDTSKPLKYAVAKTGSWLTKGGAVFSQSGIIHPWDATLAAGQLKEVMLATPVQEVSVPTGGEPLVLQGKLEWRCAVLAVKFTIDPNADVAYGSTVQLVLQRDGTSNTQNFPAFSYDPILGKANELLGEWYIILNMKDKKLSELAVTPQGYRYFPIPADDNNYVKVTGSRLAIIANKPDGSAMLNKVSVATFNSSVQIKQGFCYSLNLKVTDTNNDGIPEFARE